MNVPIAIPAHVGADGVWLEFVSPTTGKACAINLSALVIDKRGGVIEEALHEWLIAQLETWKHHNPLPEPGKEPALLTGFPQPASKGTLL